MTDQQLITEYPTIDDEPDADDLDEDISGELTRFDLTDTPRSIDRARDVETTISALDAGTYSVAFEDGDHDERHSTDVERAIADGGHHHAEEGKRR